MIRRKPIRYCIVYGWSLDGVDAETRTGIEKFIETGEESFLFGTVYYDRIPLWREEDENSPDLVLDS